MAIPRLAEASHFIARNHESRPITSRTKLRRSTMGCFGPGRGRAPASAAIRFELVVHVQARDGWEKLVVVRRVVALGSRYVL